MHFTVESHYKDCQLCCKTCPVQCLLMAGNLCSGWDAGAEDGAWDNLREAKIIIQNVVNEVAAYLAGESPIPLKEVLAYEYWGQPLADLLKDACQRTVGDRFAGQYPYVWCTFSFFPAQAICHYFHCFRLILCKACSRQLAPRHASCCATIFIVVMSLKLHSRCSTSLLDYCNFSYLSTCHHYVLRHTL